ncbi:MAG: sodium-dependent bicarbonate transport family permease [Verrucomicrobiota bacterium]
MELLQSLSTSLLSPMVLAFALGLFATLVKSDLRFPDELYTALTIYLLFAIGLKGGMKLDGVSLSVVGGPLVAAITLSAVIPIWCFFLLKSAVRLDSANAGAIAAHYGSVSAVTFSAVLAFLEIGKVPVEGFIPALLAVMEAPAIIVAIFLAMKSSHSGTSQPGDMKKLLHDLLTGKGILLLLGGLAIGLLCGKKGFEQVAPLFDAPFKGVLTLFLLEVGLVTGRRLRDLKSAGWRLVAFALVMPLLHGLLGALVGKWCGLGLGGTTVLATLAASASYIAAPAAVRIALPQASPALYLTSSLAITFPFNIVFGIPLYHAFAKFLFTL